MDDTALAKRARGRVEDGFKKREVDDPANLKKHRVYVQVNEGDTNIWPRKNTAVIKFYQNEGASVTNDTFNSPEHQWASIMPPVPNDKREPYTLPIDSTGHMFKQVMGLKELKPMAADPHALGQVVGFD